MTRLPSRLQPGDRVRFVSPSSRPDRALVTRGAELLASWGLEVELGRHVFDQDGYRAGTDEHRLADLDEAFRDPGVRAIFATSGGKGAFRISQRIDFDAVRRDPKPLVGYSDVTALHLALWNACGVSAIHGPLVSWRDHYGPDCADTLRSALMTTAGIVIRQQPDEPTAALTTGDTATGTLIGGNLAALAYGVGSDLKGLDGGILLIEANNIGDGIGQVDRQLTQLIKSGVLRGLRGVAVGQVLGFDDLDGWSVIDVLRDRLGELAVPVLGGLPVGHGPQPATVPLGTTATIDPRAGVLTVGPAVR
ncbi:S66 peptidase family protein [Kribbella sp. CA-253562]|uniref:S66 peptidase family protein n=1 Tax=Kribbella sp. CA-253562 TaxID=3239942 RepID=UPI003D8B2B2E